MTTKNRTVWRIECDALEKSQLVEAESDHQMVEILLQKGFSRILKDSIPYQDEPLVYTDSQGNLWDAMSHSFFLACNMPHMDKVKQP